MTIIRVYEVEHPGDEFEALYELKDMGCTRTSVIDRDYYDGEYIVVSADVPDSLNLMALIIERDLCMDVA